MFLKRAFLLELVNPLPFAVSVLHSVIFGSFQAFDTYIWIIRLLLGNHRYLGIQFRNEALIFSPLCIFVSALIVAVVVAGALVAATATVVLRSSSSGVQ